MSSDSTLINAEIDEIINNGRGVHNLIQASLLVNKKWIQPLRVDYLSIERDFEDSWADGSVISITLTKGTYVYDVLPYRSDIQIDVSYVPLADTGTGQDSNDTIFTRRYRAFSMDFENEGLTTTLSQQTNREALDRMAPVTIEFQLVEEYIYEVMARSVGGIYRNQSPYEVLHAVLTSTLSYVQGKDEKRILGVNTRGTPNPNKRTQVIIKQGTELADLPKQLQLNEGGVFSAGLGCYLQDQYWYIYPLYDILQSSSRSKTLTIYSVPSDRLNGSEKTFRETDNRIVILTTGDAVSSNLTEIQNIQSGNGVRFLDANTLLNGFGKVEDNQFIVDKTTNLSEVTPEKISEDYNVVKWATDPFTSNPFKHYAALAFKQGRLMGIEWQNGDCDRLEPGMLVEFMSIADDRIQRYRGCLLGLHETGLALDSGINITKHVNKVKLKLFIENTPIEVIES